MGEVDLPVGRDRGSKSAKYSQLMKSSQRLQKEIAAKMKHWHSVANAGFSATNR